MKKPLFYVMVALVVQGDDEGDAEGTAEGILDALMHLKPEEWDGYTLLKGIETTPASPDWDERDQRVTTVIGAGATITEERL